MSSKAQSQGLKFPFRLKPGAVVVFEGLDATGKSTVHEHIERGVYASDYDEPLFAGEPKFLHMPSGSNAVGQLVYSLTEMDVEIDPLARQMLHMASHAQEVASTIRPHLAGGEALFLDRWWWSTVAYGWPSIKAHARAADWTRGKFMEMAGLAWDGINADVVFLFLEPHKEDRHNSPGIRKMYEWLAGNNPDIVEFVPMGTEDEQNLFVYEAMVRRGLYQNGA
jgi:dTMP kinase